MRLYTYLNERTFNIDQDVNYIFKEGFEDFFKYISKDDLWGMYDYLKAHEGKKGYYVFEEISTKNLKTEQCKEAHKHNPMNIICGAIPPGSFYEPRQKTISVSINSSALNVILSSPIMFNPFEKGSIESVANTLKKDGKIFKREFNKITAKSTIYHELSHWLNDTLHNMNITKRLGKNMNVISKSLFGKSSSLLTTDFEIDAQIHALKQFYIDYKDKWDKFTWNDIIERVPSFFVIFETLKNVDPKEANLWFKKILKRMNREGILGKRMRKFPNI